MTAPFIVKWPEHKTALGAFLPRQVGTKSANEASKGKGGKENEGTAESWDVAFSHPIVQCEENGVIYK